MANQASLQLVQSLVDQGRFDQAVVVLRRAIAADPGNPNLQATMGFICYAQGNYAQAEYYSRQTVERFADSPEANANMGTALLGLGRCEEAVGPLRRAVEMNPRDEIARCGLVSALWGVVRMGEARVVIEEGLALSPDSPRLMESLAATLHGMGRVEEALPILNRAVSMGTPSRGLLQRWCSMHMYAPGLSRHQVFVAHLAHAGSVEGQGKIRPPRSALNGRVLRVGLMSPDFRRHSVSYVIEPFIEHADRSRVWIACYSNAAKEDEVSARLKGKADLWRSVAFQTDGAVAELIRKDRIDVLVDLAGVTDGQRLGVMAARAGPLQVTYAGYPGTTGVRAIDARIVDSITDPAGAEKFSTETLVRMDPCSTVYRPPEDAPAVGALPALEKGHVTFGCFSSLLKFNGALIAMWCRVLRGVPGSRMLIKHLVLEDAGVREDVLARFAGAGAPEGSVEVLAPVKETRGHLAVYGRVDIGLDTFPYNGTTTILESMLMGVPVVSMAGEGTASRMGLSLLTAVGMPELCAADEEGFVRTAVELAADVPRLAGLRGTLRERLLRSIICDGPGFAGRMEGALKEAWGRGADTIA